MIFAFDQYVLAAFTRPARLFTDTSASLVPPTAGHQARSAAGSSKNILGLHA